MTAKNLSYRLEVDQTPEEVYSAINDVRAWWPGKFEGPTDALHAMFTYRYQDIHYSKQQVTELKPNERVAWLVIDSRLDFLKDKAEWTGTRVVFDIARKGRKTELVFTHEGLSAESECFEACSSGWSFCITESLRDFIATGKGRAAFQGSSRAKAAR